MYLTEICSFHLKMKTVHNHRTTDTFNNSVITDNTRPNKL